MFYRWLFSAMLIFSTVSHASITLKGDEDAASGETFSFRIQQAVSRLQEITMSTFATSLYVAAHPSDGGSDIVKNYAISYVQEGSNTFIPLAAQTVTFNFEKEVENPLYDKGISYFTVTNAGESILQGAKERPIAVTTDDLKTIYMINSYNANGNNVHVVSVANNSVPSNALLLTQNIPDANGAITSGIVQIAAQYPHIFAAVAPNGGSFGASGSGIAFSIVGQVGSFTGPLIVDAQTGSVSNSTGNRAAPLDISSDELKIGSDLASIGTIVDMIWHKSTNRLYIALQTTGGAGGTDGARSIAIGRLDVTEVTVEVTEDGKTNEEKRYTYKLVIDSIAPAAAITGTNKIIGGVGSSTEVTAHKVREMVTSSALPYLIVLGNVGAPSATKKTVFALPLVTNNSSDALNGTIANKDATPEIIYTHNSQSNIDRFYTRAINDAATTASEMPLATDAATQVGGGAILNGDITDLFVHGDTVFASVQTADAGEIPGVFYSQAMFDQNGKIKGWTIWRRAVGLSDPVQSTFLSQLTGEFYTLVANGSSEVKIVKKTEWAEGDASGISPLVSIIDAQFPKEFAGVQGLHDFGITSASLGTDTPGLKDISLLVATGYQKILLAQTSYESAGSVSPIQNGAFGPLTSFDEGTITQTFPTGSSRVVAISGGVLDDLGPIVAAEVAKDGSAGSNGWLFVGGTGGVAVLSKADGSGWDTSTGLSNGLLGLESGMSFKQFGDFSLVRKLIYDDQYLYVITNSEIARVDLTQGTPGLGTITVTTIASATEPQFGSEGTFLDVLVSEKLMILGTNNGMFRLADGLDARTVDENSAAWVLVDTPEGAGPVRQFFAISQTGRAQDIARKTGGGMLYALSAYRGKNQGQIFRFDVSSVIGSSISSTTIQRVADMYIKDIPSYFASFGLFRNIFATDGALLYGTQSGVQDVHSQATLLTTPVGQAITGSSFVRNALVPVDLIDSTLISSMIQNSATGTWLIAGDHGLRANE